MRRSLLAFALIGSVALAAEAPSEASDLNDQGLAAHREHHLDAASELYAKALKLDPPLSVSAEQLALVKKFAPRLYNVAGEFFPLKDIAAIVHPDRPVIGYHLFWDDDIEFPNDDEPCDHEIVWVEYDPKTSLVTHVYTYFQGRILAPATAVAEANAHSGRPAISVEWGFHNSIPEGGRNDADATLRQHWDLAHNHAENLPHDALDRGWPVEYPGDFAAFTSFTELTDPVSRLDEDGLIFVSRWPMATINRYCLRYNFGVKTEWPWLSPAKK